MSLDINACLKAFSVAFCQYSNHPNEQTLKCVERQMDVSSLLNFFGRCLNFDIIINNNNTTLGSRIKCPVYQEPPV